MIKELTRAITELTKELKNNKCIGQFTPCEHTLEKVDYYYDDDWGYKGNKLFVEGQHAGNMMYCTKCGQILFVPIEDET